MYILRYREQFILFPFITGCFLTIRTRWYLNKTLHASLKKLVKHYAA